MKIYLLVSSISAVRGGLTSALYKRANQLSKHFKDVIILTFNTQSNIEGTEEEQIIALSNGVYLDDGSKTLPAVIRVVAVMLLSILKI